MKIRIHFDKQGGSALYRPELAGYLHHLPWAKVERLSHVEPSNWLLRLFFHLIRRCFGDKGWWADFSRSWRCGWRINFAPSGGEIVYNGGQPFPMRVEALEAEARVAAARFHI